MFTSHVIRRWHVHSSQFTMNGITCLASTWQVVSSISIEFLPWSCWNELIVLSVIARYDVCITSRYSNITINRGRACYSLLLTGTEHPILSIVMHCIRMRSIFMIKIIDNITQLRTLYFSAFGIIQVNSTQIDISMTRVYFTLHTLHVCYAIYVYFLFYHYILHTHTHSLFLFLSLYCYFLLVCSFAQPRAPIEHTVPYRRREWLH